MSNPAFFHSKNRHLPQFPRLFTVRPFLWITAGLLLGGLASFYLWRQPTFASNTIPSPSKKPMISTTNRGAVERSYEEWKQIVAKRPDYRDGYVQLALYAQELGRTDEAKTYVQKAKELDPNYTLPEVLQIELEDIKTGRH